MLHNYQSIEIDGIKIFEKLAFQNEGRNAKVLSNEACFMFMIKGGFDVRTPVDSIKLRTGDGFLSKCGDYFFEDLHPEGAKPEPVEVIGIYFHPDIIKKIIPLQLIKWNKKMQSRSIDIDVLLTHYKESLIHYLNHPQLFDEEMQLLKVKELLLLLAQSHQAPSLHHFVSALFAPNELDFRKTVESNLHSSMSLNDFAYLCGMSLATFKRNFKELYNESPAKYLKIKRLEKAASMLGNNKSQIAQIAFDCGFESASSFTRAFKNHFHVSPSEYRLS